MRAQVPLVFSTGRVTHIFFDCDNTLVQTEEVACLAAADVINKALADHGIEKTYTIEQLFFDYFGKTCRKMLSEVSDKHGFMLSPSEFKHYVTMEEALVIDLIHKTSKPCPGIARVLEQIVKIGRYKVACVSSSPIRRILAAIEAAGLEKYFPDEVVFSAKTSMPTAISKPDPAIYNFAMERMGVTSDQVITVEDSRSGAQSAIRAGIKVIAYVGAYNIPSHRKQVSKLLMQEGCNIVLNDFEDFEEVLEELLATLDIAAGSPVQPAPAQSE